MQSVATYGRLLARVLVSGLNNDFAQLSIKNSTEPATKSPLRLVTASSGLGKNQSKTRRKWSFGDDACFIANHKFTDVIGVADGVGGWRNYGIDPSAFPICLMDTCNRLVSMGRFQANRMVDMLTTSYQEILLQKQALVGSCTACVVALAPEESILYTANLGDSGFLVIRDGSILHRSVEQQHYFNAPYQLAIAPDTLEGRIHSDSKTYGTTLVLDGVIQATERDEFSYQEMITHLPINSHPNPENVLVIGGGDGGVVRELTKHPKVKKVTMCEIDEMVVNVSKRFLPHMSCGFDSEKLTLHIGDGFEFMRQHVSEFDVIITDSSDPIGPASTLFEKEYFELLKKALRPNGLLCSQGECQWLHLQLIRDMKTFCQSLYPVVDYAFASTPSYPSGQLGFLLCSLDKNCNFRDPTNKLSKEEVESLQLRYYNCDVHKASFVLPEFARKVLED